MSCPKCGWEGAAGAECARCGVVFARFEESEARVRSVRVESSGPAVAEERRIPVVGLLVVVALVAAAWWALRRGPEGTATTASAKPAAAETGRPRRDAASRAARAAAATRDGGSCPLLEPGFPAPVLAAVGGSWLETADYAFAERQQRDTGAPLLVYFRTDWCGYCRRLEQGLLAEPAVESFLADAVVRCRINPEESHEARAVSDRFGVTGYPSLFLVADGVEPIRVDTYGRGDGFPPLSADEFVARLRDDRRRLAQQLVAEGDGARRQGHNERALALLDRAVTLSDGSAQAFFYRGVARGDAGDSTGAFSDFALAAELSPGDAEIYRAAERVLAQEQRWADAAACWSLFLVDSPGNGEGRRRLEQLRARAASG